jgi:hypothetical protein
MAVALSYIGQGDINDANRCKTMVEPYFRCFEDLELDREDVVAYVYMLNGAVFAYNKKVRILLKLSCKNCSPQHNITPKHQGSYSEAKVTLLTLLDLLKSAPAKEMALLIEIRCAGQINASPPISDHSSCHIVLPSYLSSAVLFDSDDDKIEDAMSFVSRAIVLGRNSADLDKKDLARALTVKGALHIRQVVARCLINFSTPDVSIDAVFFKKANALAMLALSIKSRCKKRGLYKQKLFRTRADQTKAHLDAIKLYVEAKIIFSKLVGCTQVTSTLQSNIDVLKSIVKGNLLDTIIPNHSGYRSFFIAAYFESLADSQNDLSPLTTGICV